MCTLSWKIVPCVRTTGLIKFLISAWLVGLATTAASTSANAQCVTAGTTVTCTGTVSGSPTGFGDGTQTGLTIQVQPNASVSGTVDGLSAGANNIFLNTGMIQGTDPTVGVGIAHGLNANISNFGLISAQNGINGDGSATITNSGTISSVSATNTGVQGVAIQETAATITNSGTISGTHGGVFLTIGGTIDNSGTITAPIGISSNGVASVTNSGTITSAGGVAITVLASGGTLTIAPSSVINGTVAFGSFGILQLGGTITSGTFNVSQIGGQYQGFSVFNVVGASTWTLTGSGAQNWTVSSGTLIGDTNSLQGGLITNNNVLQFAQDMDGVYAGSISGAGLLIKSGTGDVIFTGANSYASGTSILGGTLQLGNGGASGSIVGIVVDSSVFAIDRSDTYIFSGTITGSGSFAQIGTGTTILTGANTYSGGTTISAGTLQVTNSNPSFSSSVGTGLVTLNGGTFQAGANGLGFSNGFALNAGVSNTIDTQANTLTLSGVIADGNGAGAFTKVGSGTLVLTGSNTFTGGTTISAGILQLGNGGATGSIVGNVVDNGAFMINRSGALILGGTVSGDGAVLLDGPGTTILTGANTYSGGTTINAGTLQLGNGGATGSIVGNVVDNGTFMIDRSGMLILGGTISGTGSLLLDGTGTTVLTGANTYSGSTTINAGTLVVNGSIAQSATAVNAGAVLAGAGTVGAVSVNSGASLAPGAVSAPGTLTVAGHLGFQPGAYYFVQVNPANASSTKVTVGAAASLAGTVEVAFAPGSYARNSYDILHAARLGGTTFGGVAGSLPGFTIGLSYTPTDVLLNLTATLGAGGGGNNPPGNQKKVAGAINTHFNNGGELPPGFLNLFGLSGGNLYNALAQLSGEAATGSQQVTFDAMNMFLGVLTDPFIDGRGATTPPGSAAAPFAEQSGYGASAYTSDGCGRADSERDAYGMITKAPPHSFSVDQSWSVWAAAYGGSRATDGNATLGSDSTTSTIYGTAVGADYRFSPDTLAGFALAGGGTSFTIANGLGGGWSDLFQAGVFIRHTQGPSYISGALAYGWQDITTNRMVTVAGIDQLRAQFDANAWSGRVEGGYRFVSPWIGAAVTPYAAGQFTTFDMPAHAEQAALGANNFALAYGSSSVTDARSELGLRTDRSFATQVGILTLRGRAAWAHDFNTDRDIAATFETLPGASFVVDGAAQAHDAALVTASGEMKWQNGWSVAATFEGEFSSVTRSYAGKGVARYAW